MLGSWLGNESSGNIDPSGENEVFLKAVSMVEAKYETRITKLVEDKLHEMHGTLLESAPAGTTKPVTQGQEEGKGGESSHEDFQSRRRSISTEAIQMQISDMVSPSLMQHPAGKTIALFAFFMQCFFFAMMVTYYMTWSCEHVFAIIDADWDDSAYDDLFVYNIHLCSSEQYEEGEGEGVNGTNWHYWQACVIAGRSCSDYSNCAMLEHSAEACNYGIQCAGLVSVTYAECKTVSDAIPLALSYLFYINVVAVGIAVITYFLVQRYCKKTEVHWKDATMQIHAVASK